MVPRAAPQLKVDRGGRRVHILCISLSSLSSLSQIESATLDELRAAYRALLAHHIAETAQLWQKLNAARDANR